MTYGFPESRGSGKTICHWSLANSHSSSGPFQNVYFNANCSFRVGCAARIWPKRLLLTLTNAGTALDMGLAVGVTDGMKLLVTLKASVRNWMLCFSRI